MNQPAATILSQVASLNPHPASEQFSRSNTSSARDKREKHAGKARRVDK